MALVSCEGCGRGISDKAGACPGCGRPRLTSGAASPSVGVAKGPAPSARSLQQVHSVATNRTTDAQRVVASEGIVSWRVLGVAAAAIAVVIIVTIVATRRENTGSRSTAGSEVVVPAPSSVLPTVGSAVAAVAAPTSEPAAGVKADIETEAARLPDKQPDPLALVDSDTIRPPTAEDLAGYLAAIPGNGMLIAAIGTSLGTFHCELFADKTPITVANFRKYVDAKAYNGSLIHRRSRP